MVVIIPKNLSVESFLDPALKKDVNQRLKDGMHYFVHLLLILPERQDVRKKLEETGFIFINRAVLTDILGSETNVSSVKKILISNHIIECDGIYKIGVRSMGYRLNPVYLSEDTFPVVIKTLSIRRRLNKRKQQEDAQRQDLHKTLPHLIKFLTDGHLQLDIHNLHNFIEFWAYELSKRVNANVDFSPQQIQEIQDRIKVKSFYSKNLVKKIISKDISYYRDETGLRLHSSFTGMKRSLKHFITYNGENLVGVDIMASQPYLASLLLKEDFWKGKGKYSLKSLYPDLLSLASPFQPYY